MKNSDLAILILAAGTSKRLGEPKQLLKYKGESLVKIAVKKALELSSNVTIVLGYNAKDISNEIIDFPINIVINPKYDEGIGNSISFGIKELENVKNTLIMLCDQPFIPLLHYKKLIKGLEKNSIVASKYGESPTVPAIFSKNYYFQLLNLKGDKGAKSILIKENATTIQLDKKYAIDIDTKDDVKRFLDL